MVGGPARNCRALPVPKPRGWRVIRSRSQMKRWLVALVLVLVAAAPARADDAIATYALVVGSNAGGPGQTDLRFAEDDARPLAALLGELGGGPQGAIAIVVHPTPAPLRD